MKRQSRCSYSYMRCSIGILFIGALETFRMMVLCDVCELVLFVCVYCTSRILSLFLDYIFVSVLFSLPMTFSLPNAANRSLAHAGRSQMLTQKWYKYVMDHWSSFEFITSLRCGWFRAKDGKLCTYKNKTRTFPSNSIRFGIKFIRTFVCLHVLFFLFRRYKTFVLICRKLCEMQLREQDGAKNNSHFAYCYMILFVDRQNAIGPCSVFTKGGCAVHFFRSDDLFRFYWYRKIQFGKIAYWIARLLECLLTLLMT